MNWNRWIWALALAPVIAGCKANGGEHEETPLKTFEVGIHHVLRAGAQVLDDVRVRYRYEIHEQGGHQHVLRLERPHEAGSCRIWEWSTRAVTGDKQLADAFVTRPVYRDAKDWSEAVPFKLQWDGGWALVDLPAQGGDKGPCAILAYNQELEVEADDIDTAKSELLQRDDARLTPALGTTCASGELGSRTLSVSSDPYGFKNVMYVNHAAKRLAMVRVPFRSSELTRMSRIVETGVVSPAYSAVAVSPEDIPFRGLVLRALETWNKSGSASPLETYLKDQSLCD